MDEMKNPWENLPDKEPFILEEDEKCLSSKFWSSYHLEMLPDPYLGSPETAEVYLLNLNAGFEERNREQLMKDRYYREQKRMSLTFKNRYKFLALDPKLKDKGGGYEWWYPRLKGILELFNKEGFSDEQVSSVFMCIEFFPYASETFKRRPKRLVPSQEYSFWLVRRAIENRKSIVIMRNVGRWLENVPELQTYGFIKLNSPQCAYLSCNNMNKENFDRFVSLVRAGLQRLTTG
jgi:hypothetical protein